MESHEFYMKRALELARGGWGRTNPNPLVGAVVVRDSRIIAEGYHKALGCPHAEAEAFKNARESLDGGTLYVNLEPCSHYGRTPPCARAVIQSGIARVVVAMEDPNPKVAGKGIQMLRDAGVAVEMGVLENEARKLNEIFIKYITQRKPFVIMKSAMTLDGKIASAKGDSKWISGEESRNYVHSLRNRVSAIMVGINTVVRDNPYLTTRLSGVECRDAVRIVVDGRGDIPADSNVINAESDAGMILATTSRIEAKKEEILLEKGVKIIKADGQDGRVDLVRLMDELYELEIDSILLEGGGALNASGLNSGIVDRVILFIAPKIIGGRDAITPVEGEGAEFIKDAVGLKDINVSRFGEDVMIEGTVRAAKG